MRYYFTRIHMEMDIDITCPPSDHKIRSMIRSAINALHFRKPIKARNITIMNKQEISY